MAVSELPAPFLALGFEENGGQQIVDQRGDQVARFANLLTDQNYGNGSAFVSVGEVDAVIDLGSIQAFDRIRLGQDRTGQFNERPIDNLTVETSIDGVNFDSAYQSSSLAVELGQSPPAASTIEIAFAATVGQYIRLRSSRWSSRIDEIEVYSGSPDNSPDGTGARLVDASPFDPALRYTADVQTLGHLFPVQPFVSPSNLAVGAVVSVTSPLNHFGHRIDGPLIRTAGRFGRAIELSAVDDRVVVPGNQSLNSIGINGTDFSLSFWIRPNDQTGSRHRNVITKGNANDRGPLISLRPESNRLHVRVSTTHHYNEGLESNAVLPVDQWSHVAVIHHSGELKVFLNGELDNQVTLMGQSTGNDGPMTIGVLPDSGSIAANAALDEIKWFGQALTEAQIAVHAATPVEIPNSSHARSDHFTLNQVSQTNFQTSGDVSINDVTDSSLMVYQLITAPEHGELEFRADGTFDYSTSQTNPTATFVYQTSDTFGRTTSAPVRLTPTTASTTRNIDVGSPGFSAIGSWQAVDDGSGGQGLRSNDRHGITQFRFDDVPPGRYRVAVRWQPDDQLSSTAAWSIYQGAQPVRNGRIDQTKLPRDDHGGYQFVAEPFDVTDTSVTLRLSPGGALSISANGPSQPPELQPVLADSVRLVPVDADTASVNHVDGHVATVAAGSHRIYWFDAAGQHRTRPLPAVGQVVLSPDTLAAENGTISAGNWVDVQQKPAAGGDWVNVHRLHVAGDQTVILQTHQTHLDADRGHVSVSTARLRVDELTQLALKQTGDATARREAASAVGQLVAAEYYEELVQGALFDLHDDILSRSISVISGHGIEEGSGAEYVITPLDLSIQIFGTFFFGDDSIERQFRQFVYDANFDSLSTTPKIPSYHDTNAISRIPRMTPVI